jgi:hypothetical protein
LRESGKVLAHIYLLLRLGRHRDGSFNLFGWDYLGVGDISNILPPIDFCGINNGNIFPLSG